MPGTQSAARDHAPARGYRARGSPACERRSYRARLLPVRAAGAIPDCAAAASRSESFMTARPCPREISRRRRFGATTCVRDLPRRELAQRSRELVLRPGEHHRHAAVDRSRHLVGRREFGLNRRAQCAPHVGAGKTDLRVGAVDQNRAARGGVAEQFEHVEGESGVLQRRDLRRRDQHMMLRGIEGLEHVFGQLRGRIDDDVVVTLAQLREQLSDHTHRDPFGIARVDRCEHAVELRLVCGDECCHRRVIGSDRGSLRRRCCETAPAEGRLPRPRTRGRDRRGTPEIQSQPRRARGWSTRQFCRCRPWPRTPQ